VITFQSAAQYPMRQIGQIAAAGKRNHRQVVFKSELGSDLFADGAKIYFGVSVKSRKTGNDNPVRTKSPPGFSQNLPPESSLVVM